jgi:hypothetical protein
MIQCPFCGYNNEDGSLFCEQCKSELPETLAAGSPVEKPVSSGPPIGFATPAAEAIPAAEPLPGVAIAEAVPAAQISPAGVPTAEPTAPAMPIAEAVPVSPAAPVAEAVPVPPAAPVAEAVPVAAAPPVAEAVPTAAPVAPAASPAAPAAETPGVTPAATVPPAPTITPTATPSVAPSPAAPPAAAVFPPGSQPRLKVIRGMKIGDEFPIYEGENFIGRADEKPVDIDLEYQEPPDRIWTSRQHAVIIFENGQMHIEDLNSANGTYVNRQRVYPGQKQPLKPGDVIQIGTVQMRVIV